TALPPPRAGTSAPGHPRRPQRRAAPVDGTTSLAAVTAGPIAAVTNRRLDGAGDRPPVLQTVLQRPGSALEQSFACGSCASCSNPPSPAAPEERSKQRRAARGL